MDELTKLNDPERNDDAAGRICENCGATAIIDPFDFQLPDNVAGSWFCSYVCANKQSRRISPKNESRAEDAGTEINVHLGTPKKASLNEPDSAYNRYAESFIDGLFNDDDSRMISKEETLKVLLDFQTALKIISETGRKEIVSERRCDQCNCHFGGAGFLDLKHTFCSITCRELFAGCDENS